MLVTLYESFMLHPAVKSKNTDNPSMPKNADVFGLKFMFIPPLTLYGGMSMFIPFEIEG